MLSNEEFRQLALTFEESIELPHFEITSFRVHKKIFATLHEKDNRAVLMLTPMQQSVFCLHDSSVVYPVPNKWGQKGATFFELSKVRKSVLKDALTTSYCNVAPKSLTENIKRKI